MDLLIDQQPQLHSLIDETEFLVDYDPLDCYLMFKNALEDLNDQLKKENQFFWLETTSFEGVLETYFNESRHEEFFNEVYHSFIELIADFYQEIYGTPIILFQSGYSEGILVFDGEYFDSLSDEERDSLE